VPFLARRANILSLPRQNVAFRLPGAQAAVK
jgi:hypothetical protein